jgi:hypothetical protein
VRARGHLNHLYAKIEDLEIGAGQVVTQPRRSASTSRCGSWCRALVGGRTLLVEQEVILDVARFSTRSPTAGQHLQVVPSTSVVLSYLDQIPGSCRTCGTCR